jgi:hypothetical protein
LASRSRAILDKCVSATDDCSGSRARRSKWHLVGSERKFGSSLGSRPVRCEHSTGFYLRIRLPFCIRRHDSSSAVFSSPALVVGCSSVPLGRIEPFTIVPCADLDVVHDARAIAVSLCLHATEHLVAPDFILLGGGASYVPVGGD